MKLSNLFSIIEKTIKAIVNRFIKDKRIVLEFQGDETMGNGNQHTRVEPVLAERSNKSILTNQNQPNVINTTEIDISKQSSQNNFHRQQQLFLKMIAEKRHLDPLIAAKLSGRILFQELLKHLKSENQNIHAQSLLCAIGSLAGYSAQAALKKHAKINDIDESDIFAIFKDENTNTRFYFGTTLNRLLTQGSSSLWEICTQEATKKNIIQLPNVQDIFSNTARVTGTRLFGVLRISEFNQPSDTPQKYLKTLWPKFHPIIQFYCKQPLEWPVAYAIATQQAIRATNDVLDMQLAIQIIMESAISMSKMELK